MARRKKLKSDPDYIHFFFFCQTEIDTKYMIEKSFTYQQSILILIFILCTLNSQIQLLRFNGFIDLNFFCTFI